MNNLDEKQINDLLFYEKTCEEKILGPMIEYFQIQAEEALIELNEANSENRKNDLAIIAHTLKSASAQIGLVNVSNICLELEKDGRDNQNIDFSPKIAILKNQIEHSLKDLKEFLKEAS